MTPGVSFSAGLVCVSVACISLLVSIFISDGDSAVCISWTVEEVSIVELLLGSSLSAHALSDSDMFSPVWIKGVFKDAFLDGFWRELGEDLLRVRLFSLLCVIIQ